MSEEIEQLIRSHSGVVVVHLCEPLLQGDLEREWMAGEVGQWGADVSAVQVVYSLHREWARRYRTHGSPSTLVFQSGELRLSVKGRCTCAQLRSLLEKNGLLPPRSSS